MRFFSLSFFFILFTLYLPTKAAEKVTLCEITLEGSEKIEFSKTEKKWLCGSNEVEGWGKIPLNQKALFLKGFLQSRGYHQSTIQVGADGVHVNLGIKSFLQELEVISAPPTWHWRKRRYIKNRPFTPQTLDEFNKWAKRRLQENGYPCPRVHSQAIIDESKFEILAETGQPHVFEDIQTVGENSLDPAILDRFSAFYPGDPFDIRLLEITSNRVLEEDLYLSTYYDIICKSDGGIEIVRRMIPAKPRLLSFGAGYDTESGALFRATLKQTRLNSMADNMLISLYASFIEQSLDIKHRHYFSSDLRSRLHLLSQALIKRESENSYETNTYQVSESLAYGWEQRSYSALISSGPLLERTDTVRGADKGLIDALKINTDLTFTSHLYEYFQTNPQEGWTVSVNATTQLEGAISNQTIHRLSLRHQILWNIDGWDPALLILAWRGWIGSYFLSTGQTTSDEIPTNQRFFLGGDSDLRGFGRKQLPSGSLGFLSVLYQGLELRTGDLLPYHLQPLIFADFAKGGLQATSFDPAIYYDLGIGIRWASPLGTLRGSAGKGFVINEDVNSLNPGYQFFLSYGREF